MRQDLANVVRGAANPLHVRNLVREFLQARILVGLQDDAAMIPLAFQGGTALRILFGLPRFSEDLDFALERPDRLAFDLETAAGRMAKRFARDGYETTTRLRTKTAVHSATLGFPGLPYELGVSPHETQKLNIRVEVDTQPPAGAGLSTTVVRHHEWMSVQHHDRGSLLAGKLHAVLQRPWPKGRDLFDLFWYLSDRQWPPPNLELLNNALIQSGWTEGRLEESSWRPTVGGRVQTLDWKAVVDDVTPFLEPDPNIDLFGRDILLDLLDAGDQ